MSRPGSPCAFSRTEHNLHFTEKHNKKQMAVYCQAMFIARIFLFIRLKKVKTFKINFVFSKVQIMFWF